MPLKLKTPCRSPGCRRPSRGGYCGEHQSLRWQRPAEQRRPSAVERGYDHDWRQLRLRYLTWQPFCEDCLEEGIRNEEDIEVDHVIPIDVRPDLRLDITNLRSRCRRHHRLKTNADREKYGKRAQFPDLSGNAAVEERFVKNERFRQTGVRV